MARSESARSSCAGLSLVLVLVLLAALSLGAVASLRHVAGTHKVGSSFRMQTLAWQAAQAALRYCEGQLLLPDAARASGLREAELPQASALSPAWKQAARWQPGQAPTVPPAWWDAAQARGVPAPACLVETQPLASGRVHVLTARAFAPDWRGDAASGRTDAGAVAWLQAVLLIDGGVVRERVQRRLLQPPLR